MTTRQRQPTRRPPIERPGRATRGRRCIRGSNVARAARALRAAHASHASNARRRWAARLIAGLGGALLALVLPFVVLLRGSTWLYGSGLGTWSALATAAAMTVALLALYLSVASYRLRGRWTLSRRSVQTAAVLVVAYVGYGLVFLSAANAKSPEVRTEYRALHPLLRMAVGTLVLADDQLLVTDARRALDDYDTMGLPPNARSLHLPQDDGYAHAVDLRTTGRSAFRNAVTRVWFAALGFRTLRHTGTADHLHVSVRQREGTGDG